MAETSAGILLFRRAPALTVLLGHMGGPFWHGKDASAWSIPKGTFIAEDEEPLAAALREFEEEIGRPAPDVAYRELGVFRYSSGKLVWVFAGESDFDAGRVDSNTFELEWPPRSGRRQSFPELDAAGWFPLRDARPRLVKGQRAALDALAELVTPAHPAHPAHPGASAS
ncbi:NUDIX domain-containing protein [Cryobacterium tepidiphilum]|uniref:NUDIX domain-containing protein n=1 Tax=Cryobacterium tepidiphilum TaxID=2486026 RepID=A0A3M8L9V1_9MICO|nr:NUDIX domain-containing protein [Cryobacterium tepidiphilum]RNE62281.1 NUDIX domain-containing protein [Cryobacterium tepidiphilum]